MIAANKKKTEGCSKFQFPVMSDLQCHVELESTWNAMDHCGRISHLLTGLRPASMGNRVLCPSDGRGPCCTFKDDGEKEFVSLHAEDESVLICEMAVRRAVQDMFTAVERKSSDFCKRRSKSSIEYRWFIL